jgi:hypothetical protein
VFFLENKGKGILIDYSIASSKPTVVLDHSNGILFLQQVNKFVDVEFPYLFVSLATAVDAILCCMFLKHHGLHRA